MFIKWIPFYCIIFTKNYSLKEALGKWHKICKKIAKCLTGIFMKINFDAKYKDLEKVLRRLNVDEPANSQVANEFSLALQDVIEKEHEQIKKTENNQEVKFATSTIIQDNIESQKDVYAVNLENFNLDKIGNIENLSINNLSLEENNFEENNVKIPTIVSAKRIPADKNLSSTLFSTPYDFSNKSNDNLKININKINKEIITKVIKEEGQKQGIDPALALAVAKTESSMNPMAISRDGYASKGLFQLLDSTGKELMANFAHYENYTPYDVEQNTSLGINYLRKLHGTFSQSSALDNKRTTIKAVNSDSLEKFAVAAFNAGEGRVASAQEKAFKNGLDPRVYENVESYLPNITQNYVKKVMSTREEFSSRV